jgi:Flp pilus assembly protein TadG
MRSLIRGERGSVTAEFAAVVPAVVLILALALGSLQLAGEQLRLQAAVAGAARSLGRGDPDAVRVLRDVSPDATLVQSRRGDLVCVRAVVPANLGILVGITLSASACALDDGQ